MNTIREDLKYFTKPFHDRIEQADGAKMLFSNDLTEELYKQILLKHLQFLRPIEETFQSTNWNPFNFDIKEHLRVPRLQQDLTNLNVSSDIIANLPVFEFLPQMRTLAQSLGVLYVAEGSMMGGKVIVKKIESMFGEKAHAITHYFRGFDNQSIQIWQTLCQCLETADKIDNVEHGNMREQMIISACETFLFWEKCLNKVDSMNYASTFLSTEFP